VVRLAANAELLKKIYHKLEEIDSKIENFMGLFDLTDEEIEELKKDVEDAKKGKTLEELLKEIT
jgi:peptidoglycan hydrolase CwlO-like protein